MSSKKLKAALGAAQSSDARSLVRRMKRDADFEPARDEKGQFASTGAAQVAARTSAKNAQVHAAAMKAVAAKTGSSEHAAAAEAAGKRAKAARSAARKAEAATTPEEASKHYQTAHGHEAANRQESQKLHSAAATPMPREIQSNSATEPGGRVKTIASKGMAEKISPRPTNFQEGIAKSTDVTGRTHEQRQERLKNLFEHGTSPTASEASTAANLAHMKANSSGKSEDHLAAAAMSRRAASLHEASGNVESARGHTAVAERHEWQATTGTKQAHAAGEKAFQQSDRARETNTAAAHAKAAGAHNEAAISYRSVGKYEEAKSHDEVSAFHAGQRDMLVHHPSKQGPGPKNSAIEEYARQRKWIK